MKCMDQLDETEFNDETVEEGKINESTLKTYLKDGELRSIALDCLKAVKQECEANGVASAKRIRTNYVREQVLDLAVQ